jgi:hypothetical protein
MPTLAVTLEAASTCPSAIMRVRLCAFRVHRISPHVRDDREAPLICRETRVVMPLICPTAKAEYFSGEGWTGNLTDLPVRRIINKHSFNLNLSTVDRVVGCAKRLDSF